MCHHAYAVLENRDDPEKMSEHIQHIPVQYQQKLNYIVQHGAQVHTYDLRMYVCTRQGATQVADQSIFLRVQQMHQKRKNSLKIQTGKEWNSFWV